MRSSCDKGQRTEEPCEATSLTHGSEGGGGRATGLPKPTWSTCSWARSEAGGAVPVPLHDQAAGRAALPGIRRAELLLRQGRCFDDRLDTAIRAGLERGRQRQAGAGGVAQDELG